MKRQILLTLAFLLASLALFGQVNTAPLPLPDTLTNKTLISPALTTPTITSATTSGTNTHNGTDLFTNLNGTTYFASKFTGADASCKIQSAIQAVPANGYGVINAIDLTDVGGTGACAIDPGAKSITVLLGATTYHVSQIILRTNFHLIGMGDGTGLGGTNKLPTLIQAMGDDATPPIALTTAAEGQEHVVLSGFRLVGTAGNTTQNGIFINASGLNGGLWYSDFQDIEVANFGGIGLDLEAPVGGGINQFSTFARVRVFRVAGGGYGMQIKGWNSSLKFENCQFDGSPQVSGGDGTTTNINIDDFTGGIFPPYNIKFDLLTTQWAAIGMRIDAGDSISIDQGHFEGDFNAYTIGPGDTFGPLIITMHDGFYGNGTGIHGGNGSIVNIVASTPNASVEFIDNHIFAAADTNFKGNTGSIYQCGNTVGPEGSYAWIPCSNKSVGTIALATGSIGAHACTAAQTASVPGVAPSSVLYWSFATSPVGVTGYGDGTTPFLVVTVFPTANTVNAVVCNTSAGAITPGAISIRVAAQNTAP